MSHRFESGVGFWASIAAGQSEGRDFFFPEYVADGPPQVAGNGGVPAEAQAVVLNVTATNATASTYITSYPSGSGRPNASKPVPVP